MRIRLLPYHRASRSCRALSRAAGVRRLGLVHTRFQPRPDDLIVNWGNPRVEDLPRRTRHSNVLNYPTAVAVAGNKLLTYEAFAEAGVNCPKFTTEIREAMDWSDNGYMVLARTLMRGNSGRGITLHEPDDGVAIGYAPLYTRYVPKFDEYRVHVWNGSVVDVQQKRRRRGDEQGLEGHIRSAAEGWVFCRGELDCPRVVTVEAQKAVEALNLDFGAADVGYTRNRDRATVYEVNTAPGLQGTTLERYAGYIQRGFGSTTPYEGRRYRYGECS